MLSLQIFVAVLLHRWFRISLLIACILVALLGADMLTQVPTGLLPQRVITRDVHAQTGELPSVTLTQSDGASDVEEGDAGVSGYTAVLTSQPAADVILFIDVDPQVATNQGLLVFTPESWSEPQQVLISAVDDDIVEGLHYGLVSHRLLSDDANYNGMATPFINNGPSGNAGAQTILVLIYDNDGPPTALPTPVDTIAPTSTPDPTNTAEPTSTATIGPLPTATQVVPATPDPTDALEPTATVAPTELSLPTHLPAPTVTPNPTSTLTPTTLSESTNTVEPTTMPEPTSTSPALDTPTDTPTGTPTDMPTATLSATSTAEPLPSNTSTSISTATPADASSPTDTPSPISEPLSNPASTPTSTPTNTITNIPAPVTIPDPAPMSTPIALPQPEAALDITVTADVDVINLAGNRVIHFEITYANMGREEIAGLVLVDFIPSGAHLQAEDSNSGWRCEERENAERVCILLVESVAPGFSDKIVLTVQVDQNLDASIARITNIVEARVGDDTGDEGNKRNPLYVTHVDILDTVGSSQNSSSGTEMLLPIVVSQ